MLNVNGILETALYVEDVSIAAAFYQDLFGFEKLFSDERLCALNAGGRQVLLLFKKKASLTPVTFPGGTIPPHDGEGPVHVAFSIDADAIAEWLNRLNTKGIAIESIVNFKKGESIYFRDPDNHLVELATPGIWELE